MKKFKVLLLLMVISVGSSFVAEGATPVSENAPNAISKHVEFLGIPLNGKNTDFLTELRKKKSVEVVRVMDDCDYELRMKFAGRENTQVFVWSSVLTHTVFKVTTYLPKRSNWKDLKTEFYHLHSILTKKYSFQKGFNFFDYGYSDGDGHEMEALKDGHCRYQFFYSTPGGHVYMKITEFNQIRIVYEDDANMKMSREEFLTERECKFM